MPCKLVLVNSLLLSDKHRNSCLRLESVWDRSRLRSASAGCSSAFYWRTVWISQQTRQ